MIHTGDCIEVMAAMEAESVDAIVTDPPYGLEFMGKGWDKFGRDTGPGYQETPRFTDDHMGKGFKSLPNHFRAGSPYQQWCMAWGREALRVTKPGGYLLAFGGTRTHHRLVCGLEDAGWIIRDELDWIYASGFPKGKLGAWERPDPNQSEQTDSTSPGRDTSDVPLPLEDAGSSSDTSSPGKPPTDQSPRATKSTTSSSLIRPPTSASTLAASSAMENGGSPAESADSSSLWGASIGISAPKAGPSTGAAAHAISGSSSRRNRCAACGKQLPRVGVHPTTKPVDLMRHLVRLVTPTGGTVLDPFLGSGSTAIAAELEGFPWIGIEKEAEYVAIAEARLNGVQRGMGLAL